MGSMNEYNVHKCEYVCVCMYLYVHVFMCEHMYVN